MENYLMLQLQKIYGFKSTAVLKRRFDYLIGFINKKTRDMVIPRLDALKILRSRLDALIEDAILTEYDEIDCLDSEEVTE